MLINFLGRSNLFIPFKKNYKFYFVKLLSLCKDFVHKRSNTNNNLSFLETGVCSFHKRSKKVNGRPGYLSYERVE